LVGPVIMVLLCWCFHQLARAGCRMQYILIVVYTLTRISLNLILLYDGECIIVHMGLPWLGQLFVVSGISSTSFVLVAA